MLCWCDCQIWNYCMMEKLSVKWAVGMFLYVQQNWNWISLHLPINQDLWGAVFMKKCWSLTKYVLPGALIDEFSHNMCHVSEYITCAVVHFTNDFFIIIHISWKYSFALIEILIMWSQTKLAHVRTVLKGLCRDIFPLLTYIRYTYFKDSHKRFYFALVMHCSLGWRF